MNCPSNAGKGLPQSVLEGKRELLSHPTTVPSNSIEIRLHLYKLEVPKNSNIQFSPCFIINSTFINVCVCTPACMCPGRCEAGLWCGQSYGGHRALLCRAADRHEACLDRCWDPGVLQPCQRIPAKWLRPVVSTQWGEVSVDRIGSVNIQNTRAMNCTTYERILMLQFCAPSYTANAFSSFSPSLRHHQLPGQSRPDWSTRLPAYRAGHLENQSEDHWYCWDSLHLQEPTLQVPLG